MVSPSGCSDRSNRSIYQLFAQQLEQLVRQLADPTLSIEVLRVGIAQLKQGWQQMRSVDSDQTGDLQPTGDSPQPIQAIQTEMLKQLRLLDTDLLFLQAARQSTTLQQRKRQMGDRLQLLQRYCAAILEHE